MSVAWLSMPHHGSRSSSSAALLDVARPDWASVQAGYRNRFGHPDTQVMARYLARGVRALRSDEAGATQWRFRANGSVVVHRWRALAHRDWHDRPDSGAPAGEMPSAGEAEATDPGAILAAPSGSF
jgi:competence protein ComEC